MITINGIDPRSRYGLYVAGQPDWASGPEQAVTSHEVMGRAGALIAGVTKRPRDLVVEGTIARSTYATRKAAEDALKGLVGSGIIELVWSDATQTRQITGVVVGRPSVTGYTPAGMSKGALVRFTVRADSAFWCEPTPTAVGLPAANNRKDIPLGLGPSDFILNIMGSATNPVVTYRNAGGTVVWELTITATLATTDYLSFDSRTGLISRYNSGTYSDGIGLLTTGHDVWPLPLDPQDGDPSILEWPTLQVSAGSAEVLYSKTYP